MKTRVPKHNVPRVKLPCSRRTDDPQISTLSQGQHRFILIRIRLFDFHTKVSSLIDVLGDDYPLPSQEPIPLIFCLMDVPIVHVLTHVDPIHGANFSPRTTVIYQPFNISLPIDFLHYFNRSVLLINRLPSHHVSNATKNEDAAHSHTFHLVGPDYCRQESRVHQKSALPTHIQHHDAIPLLRVGLLVDDLSDKAVGYCGGRACWK